MKSIAGIALVVVLAVVAFIAWDPTPAPVTPSPSEESEAGTNEPARMAVAEGTYAVDPSRSSVTWAGKKPLIEGYVNAGAIAIQSGEIVVGETTSAAFTFDMATISVSGTPTKPGSESSLEEHLKGERWFDVANHPTASFAITSVTPREDTDATSVYDVTGELTMKGTTGTLTFPATIYTDAAGVLHARADLEFNRTKWGITSGSDSFFDNLADNVIDDMVALSFHLVAERE